MPVNRATSPDLVILSTDPPTSPPPPKKHRHVPYAKKTKAKGPKRAKAAKSNKSAKLHPRLDPDYAWPIKGIIGHEGLYYKIAFMPACLTPVEYQFWAQREEFASESVPDVNGCITVEFEVGWQLEENTNTLARKIWDARNDVVIVLSSDNDE
ncbi:hypothetical protein P7C70_g5615, partial [Phenoliferia sp. Uapishka_3]